MLTLGQMNVEKIEVKRESLAQLMTNMGQGSIRIPRFQRDFVWPRGKIIELLDSMYKEYPIGTIFLWEPSDDLHHMIRTVDYLDQPKISKNKTYALILDGQQRLTSLYAVINGLQIEGEDYSKIVFDLAQDNYERMFRYRQPDTSRWISIRDIIYHNDEIYDQLPSPELRRNFARCYQLLNNYPFSVVIVKDVNLIDAVEIFERINRAGKRLTRYDLITAAVISQDFDLREKTNADILEPLNRSFGEVAETNIPQSLALNIRGNTEQNTQMELDADDVKAVWPETVQCFMRAVNFVRNNVGVIRSDFLPYDGILPVLEYYFYYAQADAVLSPVHKRQLETWFWRTAFSERYSGASQTRMSEDAKWIRSLVETNAEYDGNVTVSLDSLIDSSMRSSSALRNGILCLLVLQNPLHFRNATPIHLQDDHYARVNNMEMHHIFPVTFLDNLGFDRRIVHQIPNFCFLPLELSRWINDRGPSEYMQIIWDEVGDETFHTIMNSHLIPINDSSGIWTNDYERFLRQRAELIMNEIRRVCGISDFLLDEYRNPVIDEIEIAFRELIHERLSAAYGLDYWERYIPNDIDKEIDKRIQAEVRRQPGLEKKQFNDPRSMLDFCDVSDYEKIILKHWDLFSGLFRSRPDFEHRIRSLREFRNAVKHNRSLDRVLEHSAQAAVLWFAQALDLDLTRYDVLGS